MRPSGGSRLQHPAARVFRADAGGRLLPLLRPPGKLARHGALSWSAAAAGVHGLHPAAAHVALMPDPTHDVVIVGSGAGGGAAAWALSRRGVRVLVLEAGPDVRPVQGLPAEQPTTGSSTAFPRSRVRRGNTRSLRCRHSSRAGRTCVPGTGRAGRWSTATDAACTDTTMCAESAARRCTSPARRIACNPRAMKMRSDVWRGCRLAARLRRTRALLLPGGKGRRRRGPGGG